MRPIDADALMDFYLMRPTEEFLYERQYTAEDVALKIKEAPTTYPIDEIVSECKSYYADNCNGCRFSPVCGEFFRGVPCEWET